MAWHQALTLTKCANIFMHHPASTRNVISWWRHEMETFSASLALCEGNSPATGEFPSQRPVTRGFDVFFDLRLNKRLSKQSKRWWFEPPSRPLWRHCNVFLLTIYPLVLYPYTWMTWITNAGPYCNNPNPHRCIISEIPWNTNNHHTNNHQTMYPCLHHMTSRCNLLINYKPLPQPYFLRL